MQEAATARPADRIILSHSRRNSSSSSSSSSSSRRSSRSSSSNSSGSSGSGGSSSNSSSTNGNNKRNQSNSNNRNRNSRMVAVCESLPWEQKLCHWVSFGYRFMMPAGAPLGSGNLQDI